MGGTSRSGATVLMSGNLLRGREALSRGVSLTRESTHKPGAILGRQHGLAGHPNRQSQHRHCNNHHLTKFVSSVRQHFSSSSQGLLPPSLPLLSFFFLSFPPFFPFPFLSFSFIRFFFFLSLFLSFFPLFFLLLFLWRRRRRRRPRRTAHSCGAGERSLRSTRCASTPPTPSCMPCSCRSTRSPRWPGSTCPRPGPASTAVGQKTKMMMAKKKFKRIGRRRKRKNKDDGEENGALKQSPQHGRWRRVGRCAPCTAAGRIALCCTGCTDTYTMSLDRPLSILTFFDSSELSKKLSLTCVTWASRNLSIFFFVCCCSCLEDSR
jgi:hypothetical protein